MHAPLHVARCASTGSLVPLPYHLCVCAVGSAFRRPDLPHSPPGPAGCSGEYLPPRPRVLGVLTPGHFPPPSLGRVQRRVPAAPPRGYSEYSHRATSFRRHWAGCSGWSTRFRCRVHRALTTSRGMSSATTCGTAPVTRRRSTSMQRVQAVRGWERQRRRWQRGRRSSTRNGCARLVRCWAGIRSRPFPRNSFPAGRFASVPQPQRHG